MYPDHNLDLFVLGGKMYIGGKIFVDLAEKSWMDLATVILRRSPGDPWRGGGEGDFGYCNFRKFDIVYELPL